MHAAFNDRLRCPHCRDRLGLQIDEGSTEKVLAGWLDCWKCVARFPIVDGIPRFAPVTNYADPFGKLWADFRAALLDSARGTNDSRERFLKMTGWTPESLRDQWVLEVGCGAGRFTEIALDCGANVIAVDYSAAIDACHRNLGGHPRLHLLQADLFELPFRPGQFDAVFGFGVLHRTPDAHRALLALPEQLRDGGRLAVDIVPPRWFRQIGPTAWLRWLTRSMSPERTMAFARLLVGGLLPIQRGLGAVPGIGKRLERCLPIVAADALETCRPEALRERAELAMCDRLTSRHHQPCRQQALAEWLTEAGLDATEVFRAWQIVGRGVKPARHQEVPVGRAA